MSKINLKQVKEERADIVQQMEALHNDNEGGFDENAQTQWDELKNSLESKDHIISREELIAQKKAEQDGHLRNADDGEAQELQKYSFKDALLQVANNRVEGFYAEMSQLGHEELEKAGASPTGGKNSLIVPFSVLKNKKMSIVNTMNATTAADGGNAIRTELGSFIENLYDRMVTTSIGADMLTGLVGNLDWPTESTVAGFSWADGENVDLTKTSPKVGKVSISPKRGGTFVDLSNRLLAQTSPSIESRIERQILTAAQIGLETAGINGTGADGQPRGILNTSGIGTVFAGGASSATAAGADLTREDIIALETAVSVENADIGALNYLTNAKVRGVLKSTKVDTGSGLFIWPMNDNMLNGYNAAVTNLVPSNLGTDPNDTSSAVIFGNFNDLVYGMWGGLEILFDPYTQALKGTTRLVLNMYADVAVLRPKSFAAIKDAKSQ